jgi:hypothetical protein
MEPQAADTRGTRFGLALRLAAPYLAVVVFWCLLHNAWLAIIGYHAQMLWWSRGTHPKLTTPRPTPTTLLILASVPAGPALGFLLPHIARTDIAAWLHDYHLTGPALVVMTFYFGLVHPILEQIHWAPLRERTPLAHLAFAGYHLLVLCSILSVPWLAVCFVVLGLASWLWTRMVRASGSLWLAIASQGAADLGIVLVAALGFME